MISNNVYRIADGVRVRDEDFGLLVVSKSTPALALNNDMKLAWNLIDGVRSVSDISNTINEAYPGIDIASAIEDVFDKLIKLNLVEAVSKV
ncbi:hypothetical protein PilKf_01818 [Pillotina sp. SPG140]|jgi:hypothetical protein